MDNFYHELLTEGERIERWDFHYSGLYVSDFGRIWVQARRSFGLTEVRSGYLVCKFKAAEWVVHRLVIEVWGPPLPELYGFEMHVRHLGETTDNRVWMLAWEAVDIRTAPNEPRVKGLELRKRNTTNPPEYRDAMYCPEKWSERRAYAF